MKTKIILFAIMTLTLSCESEDFLEPNERPCYDVIFEGLSDKRRGVSDEVSLITGPDGGWETIEECLAIQNIYLNHLDYLENEQGLFYLYIDELDCSTFDINSIENLYIARIQETNHRLDTYYSCE